MSKFNTAEQVNVRIVVFFHHRKDTSSSFGDSCGWRVDGGAARSRGRRKSGWGSVQTFMNCWHIIIHVVPAKPSGPGLDTPRGGGFVSLQRHS